MQDISKGLRLRACLLECYEIGILLSRLFLLLPSRNSERSEIPDCVKCIKTGFLGPSI